MWAGFRETNKGPATKAAIASLNLKQPEKGTGTRSPIQQLDRKGYPTGAFRYSQS